MINTKILYFLPLLVITSSNISAKTNTCELFGFGHDPVECSNFFKVNGLALHKDWVSGSIKDEMTDEISYNINTYKINADGITPQFNLECKNNHLMFSLSTRYPLQNKRIKFRFDERDFNEESWSGMSYGRFLFKKATESFMIEMQNSESIKIQYNEIHNGYQIAEFSLSGFNEALKEIPCEH